MNTFYHHLQKLCVDANSVTMRNVLLMPLSGCQLDFVKKKVFLKGSVFKKKVFNARKKVFVLRAYLNKNSKR